MYVTAYLALLLAMLLALGGGLFAILQILENRSDRLARIKKAQWVIAAAMLYASACLLHALFWQDYSLEYVAAYTDNILPVFYRLTAFWAGQPGSLLFWALITALCGFYFAVSRKIRPCPEQALWFWTIFYAVEAFFCLLLTSYSNPFILLSHAPLDGQGLNPLLQNTGMIFHPPLLFMGYAFFTAPACLALACLLAPQDKVFPWAKAMRPQILIGWIFLTAGICLGAWWAYMELGWGGYWGWDPVENASLLPWLAITAALHLLAVYNASGKLERVSAFMIAFAVILAFFATYLTRSGVIQSVHAFGDGGVGTPLLVFTIAAFVLTTLVSLASPGQDLALAKPLSREGAILLAIWLFMALTLIILIATIWPVLTSLAGAPSMGLDASFYNRVCLPLGCFLILLLAICQWLGWNGGLAGKNTSIKLMAIGGAFCASAAAFWISGYQQIVPLLTAAGAIAAICGFCLRCFNFSLWHNPRFIAALGAHLGIAVAAIGIAFSGPYKIEADLLLAKNGREVVGPYVVELTGVTEGARPGYDYLKATLDISLNGERAGILEPERRIYAKFGSMQFSEVDVLSKLGEDIYASLLGVDEDHKVLVRIALEPLVNWIWAGFAIMCLVPLFGARRKSPGTA